VSGNSEIQAPSLSSDSTQAAMGLLFQGNPQPMWIYDAEPLSFLAVNQAAIDVYGYSREEFLAMGIGELWPSGFQMDMFSAMSGDLTELQSVEFQHKKKDGELIDVKVASSPLTYEGVQSRLAFAVDITEQKNSERALRRTQEELEQRVQERTAELIKANEELLQEIVQRRQAEKTLREREEFFRLLSENMTDMIAVVDRDGRRLYNSASYRNVLGDPEGLHGTDSFADIHPDDQERVKAIFRQTVETGEGQRAEYRFLLPDRSVRYVESQGSVIKDESGKVSKVVVVSRDMTERKLAESELSRLATAVEAAAEAIIITDAEESIVYVNPAFEHLTGYGKDEVIGRTSRSLKLEDSSDLTEYNRAWDRLKQGIAWTGALIDHRRDGSPFSAEETIAPIRDYQGSLIGFVAVIRDVTERRQAEEKIHRMNEELESRVARRTAELESANKELEAFSYSVSHDLRAPLRAIDGFSRILLDDCSGELSEEAQRLLGRVRHNTRQMGELIDDLLTFSRLSRQPLTKVNTSHGEVVARALTDLREERKGREVAINIGELAACMADPALLKQVYINLLSNALKFTRDAGSATIDIQSEKVDGATVYSIRDNGVGFDARYDDKLFGVFQSLHRAEDYEGTGVGLAIVQRIVQRHGGRVWAMSETGKGATFYFTLDETKANHG
jgi:PAS domain S-box-containing protein